MTDSSEPSKGRALTPFGMSDKTTKATARAVQEAAIFGQKIVGIVDDVGTYTAGVLGRLPHDAVGMVADWVQHKRLRNGTRLLERTREILQARGLQEPSREVSPNIALEIMGIAQDESRAELQDLWARLLANAADNSRPRIRREFIEIVKGLEPLDALILDNAIPIMSHSQFDTYGGVFAISKKWTSAHTLRSPEIELSVSGMRKKALIRDAGYNSDNCTNVDSQDIARSFIFDLLGSELMLALRR